MSRTLEALDFGHGKVHTSKLKDTGDTIAEHVNVPFGAELFLSLSAAESAATRGLGDLVTALITNSATYNEDDPTPPPPPPPTPPPPPSRPF